MIKTILVTGSNGQLGRCIKDIELKFPQFSFIFTDSDKLDITNHNNINQFFSSDKIDWCINCAAYTAVDKAETESPKAFLVNSQGVENLAQACQKHKTKLIHISTDFVFNGEAIAAYNENDVPDPIGVYGKSKFEGELAIAEVLKQHYIIRTSWLYSEYGNNFLKTMLRLAGTVKEINVVNDQLGTPTYAKDLAETLITIILTDNNEFGIYHYSNEGMISWFEFAQKIFELNGNKVKVNSISTEEYPTLARRPKFSVLDKTKIKQTFNLNIPHWEDSLKIALKNLK